MSGKPVSIAFEEIAAGKATYTRPDPEEEAALAAAIADAAEAGLLGEAGEGESTGEAEIDRDGRRRGRGPDRQLGAGGGHGGPPPMADDRDIRRTAPSRAGPGSCWGSAAGIAAYKAVEVCRRLVDAGVHVTPVLTDDATRFVGAVTFSALASEPAQRRSGTRRRRSRTPGSGQQADLVVVAPATAHTLARYAAGLADDLLTATLLATRAPVMVCPAMHTEMWEHPSVQREPGHPGAAGRRDRAARERPAGRRVTRARGAWPTRP